MNNDIKEILDNIKKYQFQLLTSTGLGHEYFYCYGDDRFENWLKRKNIKYKIVKSDLLDYITKLQEENEMLNKECDTYMKISTKKQQRIDKAIEYIINCPEYLWSNVNTKVLLNILKGENNDI